MQQQHDELKKIKLRLSNIYKKYKSSKRARRIHISSSLLEYSLLLAHTIRPREPSLSLLSNKIFRRCQACQLSCMHCRGGRIS